MNIATWIKNTFSPKARLSDYIQQKILEIYGGASTSSGVSVNSDTAMRLITVHSCVKVLSETVKQLPLHMMERAGKLKNKAEDFYLYELLHDQPNTWMTAPEFWGMAEAHIAMRGNFYAYKAQLPGRPIRSLIPLKAGAVQEVKQHADYSLTYRIATNDESVAGAAYDDGLITGTTGSVVKEFSQDKIMHLRGLTLNGITGVNPIQYARETMGLGLAGERFLARFFGKGMHPGVIFKHPKPLNAPAHANLKANLKAKYEGLGESWEMMLVDEDMNVEFPPIKLVDAQFLELMKLTEAQVCGLFRVPLMLIQSGDKAPTYASAEQFMLSFVVHSLMPILVNIEKAIRRDLLTPEEKKRDYAKFAVGGLLRGDFKARMEGYQIGVNSEIFSPNECRDWEDLNPYEGGDEYRTRTSTVKEEDSKEEKGNEPKVQE
ncbi:MAG: phage portal protein [Syntrophorhabdaceae bacterium]